MNCCKLSVLVLLVTFASADGVIADSLYPPTPVGVEVVPGDGRVTVTWAVPGWFVLSWVPNPLTGFIVTSTKTGKVCRASKHASKCVITGLVNGVPDSFTVASRMRGFSGYSDPATSRTVIPYKTSVDGACGGAGGAPATVAPDTKSQCQNGVSLGVTQTLDGLFHWQCLGYGMGSSATCQTSHSSGSYWIGGKGPAGGTVFHLSADGLHGLEAGFPLSTNVWGCNNKYLGVTDTALGAGSANTSKILTSCGDKNTPAALVHSYSLNGYSDWFLPSRDEMAAAAKTLGSPPANGGLAYYWTSSETGPTTVIIVIGSDSKSDYKYQSYNGSAVPVRSF